MFGNPVGYNFVTVGRRGIEQSENKLLAGEENEFASIIDELQNQTPVGADITLTLDAGAQRVATQALQSAVASTPGSNGGGSVVAIEPSTGAVRVMASTPGYDPNAVKDPKTFSRLSEDESAPLFNRPTQAAYEPGSTMKVVTAAAALDSGEFTPQTTLSGQTGIEIDGVPLSNAGGETFGEIDMDFALTHSVNVYFAQVGEKLGTETMFEYMNRFGFNKDPELDYPDGQMRASGVYDGANLLDSGDAIDIGRVAIGQERLLTTPIQMAEVAATVANDGKLEQPTFLQSAKDPDGRTIEELDPSTQSDVISAETANELTTMMTHVTQEGTAAGLTVGGESFAGKTGTAEVDVEQGINRPWFIGFAPAENPQIAVAVMLETCDGLLRRRGRGSDRDPGDGGPDRGMRLERGSRIGDRYTLVGRLGSGGMADVWLADDAVLKRRVALKFLHERFAQDPQFVERFRIEAQSAAGLQHPNLVGVYDRGEFEGRQFIAMEYVEGASLKDLIVRGISVGEALEIVRQVLDGVGFAHERGIIHRDLKPQNVLVDGQGRARVTDFGIARAGASEITQTGSVLGTAQYLSPEQAQGLDVTAASDLYSVGVMLYEALTGRVPFEAETRRSPSP